MLLLAPLVPAGASAPPTPLDERRSLAERFAPERMRALLGIPGVDPHWIDQEDRFWYRTGPDDRVRFELVDAARGEKQPLFDHAHLRAALNALGDRFRGIGLAELQDLRVRASGELTFTARGRPLRCRLPRCTPVPASAAAADAPNRPVEQAATSPDGRYSVLVRDHDLHAIGPDGRIRRLSHDGERWRSFAIDPHTTYDRREGSPVRWLGRSSRFYVQRWDRRDEGEFHLLDSLADPRPAVETYRSAIPGDRRVPVHELWIGDAANGRLERVAAERWHGQFIGDMDLGGGFGPSGGLWPSADGRRLYFVRIARGYRMRELCVVDVATGAVKVLVAESDSRRIDIRHAQLALVDDGRQLVWLTERDGWKHLDLIDANGTRIRSLTVGDGNVVRILRVDSARREVWFTAVGRNAGENPYHLHAWRVGLDGGDPVALTPGDATHPVRERDLSPSGRYLVDNASRPDLPTRSRLRDRGGKLVMELERADLASLEQLGWRAPQPFVVPAADGATPLHGVMWKPLDFDPTRRYPLITWVYPGPGAYANTAVEFDPADPEWAAAHALAQLGAIVIRAGHRGDSSFRHRSYSLHGYGRSLDFPLDDARHTIEVLAQRHPYIDTRRVGITGYSGGGFMTVAAMLLQPDFFKVGVAGAGNHDNNLYEQNSGEYHFGMAWAGDPHDPSGDARWTGRFPTTIEHAQRLAGRLLLLHGELDRDVHPAHTLRLVDAFVRARKHVDLVIVPGVGHGALETHPYHHRRQWAYFAEHLLGLGPWPVDLYTPTAERPPTSTGSTE